MFSDYINAGWKLCAIPPGTKGPRQTGWNLEKNALTHGDIPGAGLMHSYSGTCALDIDDLAAATSYLAANGIDLLDLMLDPAAVRIDSGRPNRAKLLYKLDSPLFTIKPAGGALELRSQTKKFTSVQDVLPPTIHPDTGKPYQWIGDWRNLPEIPAALKALWISLTTEETEREKTETVPTADLSELRGLLERRSPDCVYDDWLKAGMAVHHETEGSDEGFALWDEWSAPSDKYPGIAVLRSHWLSFRGSSTPITADSLRAKDVATVDQFDVFKADGQEWSLAGSVEAAVPKLTLIDTPEFFTRPEPAWIIPGVLPQAGFGVISGPWSSGKTFVAVDTAACLSLGLPWRGIPVKQRQVIYIAAEDDSGVQIRLMSAMAARGWDLAAKSPIRILTTAPILTSKVERQALLDAVAAEKAQPGIIFFDTLAAVIPGAEENSAKDMGEITKFCYKLHKQTGAMVVVIHHTAKGQTTGMRGSSAVPGAADVIWEITDQESHREMKIAKMKNAPAGGEWKFLLSPFGSSCVVEWV